jgi:hypothetical protein
MARYRNGFTTSAAQAGSATTPVYALGPSSSGSALLRRFTAGFSSGGTTPTSEQVVIQLQPATGLTNGSTVPSGKLRSTSVPALSICSIATGSITAVGPPFIISLNTQSAADLPWEQLEEWEIPLSTWLAFMLITTLPASTTLTMSFEFEE